MINKKIIKVSDQPATWIEIDQDADEDQAKTKWLEKHSAEPKAIPWKLNAKNTQSLRS